MTDIPETLDLIVTNPSLSGRAMKAMILVRDDAGGFDVRSDYPSAAISDGQTTIIRVPLGSKIVICEASDHSMPAAMSVHPAITGRPAGDPNAQAWQGQRPLSVAEEARRVALAEQPTRSPTEVTELAALQARVVPWLETPHATGFTGQPHALTVAEEARRASLTGQVSRTTDEQAELDALQARANKN